jgi:hypothetical protein
MANRLGINLLAIGAVFLALGCSARGAPIPLQAAPGSFGAFADGQVTPAAPTLTYPRYVAGERNGPPEDCGGIPGFHEMLAAAADPEHPEHAEIKEWLDGYDPEEIDELPIKYALLRIANRRNAAKTRLAKKATKPG